MNERANLMNPEYLAALAARVRNAAEAATPGPWAKDTQDLGEHWVVDSSGVPIANCPIANDAEYIAAATPWTIVSLLDERDALTARVDALEEENEKLWGALEPFMPSQSDLEAYLALEFRDTQKINIDCTVADHRRAAAARGKE